MNHCLPMRSRFPAWRRHALAAVSGAALVVGAASAHAISFVAYANTSGTPGPNGDHIFWNTGAAPVQVASSHDGQRSLPHVNGSPLSSSTTVQARAFARADMNGLHLSAQTAGSLRDAQPYRSEVFATRANARAGLGDSFVITPAQSPATFLSASMTLAFSVHASLFAYANGTPSDPQNAGTGDGRSEWRAEFVARDDTAGVELGRITVSQSCAKFSHLANLRCSGDLPGLYAMNVSLPSGHALSIALGGETWSDASGGQYRGGDMLTGAIADLAHTIAWAGITNLRDQDGRAIASFTAISPTSSYNYVNPFASAVPEPAGAALMLAGLLGLAASRRRARR